MTSRNAPRQADHAAGDAAPPQSYLPVVQQMSGPNGL